MPTRKMRVEVFDGEGNKYTVSFEGQMDREKALRLFDLVELLGGVPGEANSETSRIISSNELSKFEKVRVLLRKHFPLIWFSSREIQPIYEQEFKEPISLSTVSTYLARMSVKGLVVKSGSANSLKYKLVTTLPQAAIKQRMP